MKEDPRRQRSIILKDIAYPVSVFSIEILKSLPERTQDCSQEIIELRKPPKTHFEIVDLASRYLELIAASYNLFYKNAEGRAYANAIFQLTLPCNGRPFHRSLCLEVARLTTSQIVSCFDLFSKNIYKENPDDPFHTFDHQYPKVSQIGAQSSFQMTVDNLVTAAQVMAMATYHSTTYEDAFANLKKLSQKNDGDAVTLIEQLSDTIAGFWAETALSLKIPQIFIDGKVSSDLLTCLKVLKRDGFDYFHGGCPARHTSYVVDGKRQDLEQSAVLFLWEYMTQKLEEKISKQIRYRKNRKKS